MAEVVPFKGVLYNPDLITNIADVIAPPYDVISVQEQEAFHQQHPNNVIRLILGKTRERDSGRSDVHQRAARYFNQWMTDKILVRDSVPAYYLTSVDFPVADRTVTRYGIIGNVRLAPFDKGIVLPHERTFSKVKSERLQLMLACHTNFSPIFGLYADGNGVLERLRWLADIHAPDIDLVDNKGLRHKLWRVTDPETQAHIHSSLKDQCIYIADGHHRYETALSYREWARENIQGFNQNHPANFVMMSLSSLKDPGMVIFPAHRLLKEVPEEQMSAFMDKAGEHFDIHAFSTDAGVSSAMDAFNQALAANSDKNAIGVYLKHHANLYVLVLKDDVMTRLFGDQLPEALCDLDVTVLTHLLMMELLGFDQDRLDDATRIRYATTSQDAAAAVDEGRADMAFILNPTKIEQVQRVAGEGLIMPRKSTYFYPKVGSGLVINLLK
ncbi:MAG: DUF1015 domain-containing protein [Desulfobacteraceae bacterium]|jgi:uncharacterized protein (DUF1015 family)